MEEGVMSPQRLKEIEGRLEEASPRLAEAYVGKAGTDVRYEKATMLAETDFMGSGAYAPANARLFANAYRDLRALLAYVRELEGVIRDMQQDSAAYRLGAERMRARAADECRRVASHNLKLLQDRQPHHPSDEYGRGWWHSSDHLEDAIEALPIDEPEA